LSFPTKSDFVILWPNLKNLSGGLNLSRGLNMIGFTQNLNRNLNSISDTFATRSCRPLTFQTKNSDRSNIQNLKYKRFTASGCKDKMIRKLEFVAKTQLLWSLSP